MGYCGSDEFGRSRTSNCSWPLIFSAWAGGSSAGGRPNRPTRPSRARSSTDGRRSIGSRASGSAILRSHSDHPEFPDSISIIGETDGRRWHYFDSRGVHRVLEFTVTDDGWEVAMDRHSASAKAFASPDAPGFSQRLTVAFEDEDQKMSGRSQLSYDDENWKDDLQITYRRAR